MRHLVADVMDENGRMQAFMRRHGYAEALGEDTWFEADAGGSLCLVRPLASAAALVGRPVLVIHSEGDRFVPVG